MSLIDEYISEALSLEEVRQQMEDDLKRVVIRLNELKRDIIPLYLDEHGIGLLHHEEADVTVGDRYEGSLPKDPIKRERAIDYLNRHGAGDIIKVDVELHFAKGERDQAQAIAEDLARRGFSPMISEGVHPSTLKSFVRHQVEAGAGFDPKEVGVYHMREARIKPKVKE